MLPFEPSVGPIGLLQWLGAVIVSPVVEGSAIENPTIEANLRQFLLVLSVSLGVATLSRVFSILRNIPYTLLLLLVGLGLAVVDVRLVNLSPELILFIFLPPLLFEAAWNIQWSRLKSDIVPILLYAVLGVVICIAGLVFGLQQIAGASLATALLVGASLSATDPVSVTALFRELGVDKRLTTLMEGESLFNDGVAVVAFNLLLGIALGIEQFDASLTVARFGLFVGLGISLGGLIGFGISFFNSALRHSLSRTIAYLSIRLWHLYCGRRTRGLWRHRGGDDRHDFRKFRFENWHESSNTPSRVRVLGVFSLFC